MNANVSLDFVRMVHAKTYHTATDVSVIQDLNLLTIT